MGFRRGGRWAVGTVDARGRGGHHRPAAPPGHRGSPAADVVVIGSEARIDPELAPAAAQLEPETRFETWVTVEPSTRGTDSIERMRLVRDDIAARVADLRDRPLAAPAR